MKLLINLSAHDGIISQYTGVGTMVNRYITMLDKLLKESVFDYTINLITPEYHTDSFAYSKENTKKNSAIKNANIIQISNGSNAEINFGSYQNWYTLSQNTANFINSIDKSCFDKVLTIYNDVPFTLLANLLSNESNHIKIWIPHSTVKIHDTDVAIKKNSPEYYQRLEMEMQATQFINSTPNCYLAGISEFMCEHMITEYGLDSQKLVNLINGELLEDKTNFTPSPLSYSLYNKIKDYPSIILSFGRAEPYKNHQATMLLGKELDIPAIVIAQGYFKGQPIMQEYSAVAKKTGATLFIDPPLSLANLILNKFPKKMIALIPSKKESMGLIINEVRKLNRNNILIVANDIPGLQEQITDGIDGVKVNLDNIKQSAQKIKNYFNSSSIKKFNYNAQTTLKTKYDFQKNFTTFFYEVLDK